MVVFTDDFLDATVGTNIYSTLLWILAAIFVVRVWGPGTLSREAQVSLGPLVANS